MWLSGRGLVASPVSTTSREVAGCADPDIVAPDVKSAAHVGGRNPVTESAVRSCL